MSFKKPHQKLDARFITQEGDKFVILPKGLNIVWGNDSRYWKVPEQGAAELTQVSWLEVSGVVKISNPKKYKVTFEVKVKEDGFGWKDTDVLVMAKVGRAGKYIYKATKISPGCDMSIPSDSLEIDVAKPSDLHFGLYEVWSGKWKGGLQILRAVVSPTT